MGVKKYLKRLANYLFHGMPTVHTTAQIYQISYGCMLKNKNIIVTGGSRGLGFYIAKKCISEGANVLITGRSEKILRETANRLHCNYYAFDMGDTTGIENFLDNCLDILGGRIDAIVSNAGISLHEGDVRHVTIEGFDSQLNVNLKGGYFLAKAYLEKYIIAKSKSGNMIFITSERGSQCDDIPYGLTKSAMNSFVRGMSRRAYKAGLRVNGVAPGVTASDMTGRMAEGDITREGSSSGRIFLPEEVAEVTCFLLSDASKCISGEIINCDAGEYLNPWWGDDFNLDSNRLI